MKTKKLKTFTGINIQYPISTLILDGSKTIETRTYPIPKKLLGVDVLLIETPGKSGQFKARIAGIIKFTECFKYHNKREFEADYALHKVDRTSEWAWSNPLGKWGWRVKLVKTFPNPRTLTTRKGIRYTNNITLPS